MLIPYRLDVYSISIGLHRMGYAVIAQILADDGMGYVLYM